MVMPKAWQHKHVDGVNWMHVEGQQCDRGEIVKVTPNKLAGVYVEALRKQFGPEGSDVSDWSGTDFASDVRSVFDEALAMLLKKHQDYGPKNISGSPGGPLNGLRVRMHDKLARVNNLLDSGAEPENESLRDSFLDLMNYSAIAMLVLDGNWPES